MLQSRRRSIGRDARTVFITLNVSRNHLSAIENARALPNETLLRQLAYVLEWRKRPTICSTSFASPAKTAGGRV